MSDFKGVRKTLSHSQRLNGSKERIFPLLCPTREYDWIEEWSCELIHSHSGLAEPNCVFRTESSGTRLDGAPEEIWIVSRYEPPIRIEFVKFAAAHYVVKYEIVLTALDEGGVTAGWTLYLTGLSEAGNRLVAARRQDEFNATIQALEAKLNHYLSHGECLRSD